MGEAVFFRNLTTKGLTAINSGERYFEGYLTVQVKDKQGEVTIVDELMKVLPIWIDRGAPISDTHSNRIIGKGINYSKVEYVDKDGEVYPAIKVTGKIHKNYELDNDIWAKIKSGEYKGLSFGGATKSDREPMRMKDGSIAYSLKDLEHYEVAVCRDPAVPLALITEFNTLAKATLDGVDLGGGRMLIKCDDVGCYVDKDNKEAGLKAPEARNEALVYDDKTHDQPSETPLENQAKIQKEHRGAKGGKEAKNIDDIIREIPDEENKEDAIDRHETGDISTTESRHKRHPSVGKTHKLENAKELIDEHIKEMKKGEDWSNADGDRHGMYNQDTDEGGMGKKHTGPKGCKCGDPKCKDPKCKKHKREVGTGHGAEQNDTGEVHWSGSGSPYPKKKGSDHHMTQEQWEQSDKDTNMTDAERNERSYHIRQRKRKRKRKAIHTNIISRLKLIKADTEKKKKKKEEVVDANGDVIDMDNPYIKTLTPEQLEQRKQFPPVDFSTKHPNTPAPDPPKEWRSDSERAEQPTAGKTPRHKKFGTTHKYPERTVIYEASDQEAAFKKILADREADKKKKKKKSATITNIHSRLKSLDFLLMGKKRKLAEMHDTTEDEQEEVSGEHGTHNTPSDLGNFGYSSNPVSGLLGEKDSLKPLKQRKTDKRKKKKKSATITNIHSRLKSLDFLLRKEERDPTKRADYPERKKPKGINISTSVNTKVLNDALERIGEQFDIHQGGKKTKKKRRDTKPPHTDERDHGSDNGESPTPLVVKDGEFGGMNTGEVEWTEPRDTANDRRDSNLKKKEEKDDLHYDKESGHWKKAKKKRKLNPIHPDTGKRDDGSIPWDSPLRDPKTHEILDKPKEEEKEEFKTSQPKYLKTGETDPNKKNYNMRTWVNNPSKDSKQDVKVSGYSNIEDRETHGGIQTYPKHSTQMKDPKQDKARVESMLDSKAKLRAEREKKEGPCKCEACRARRAKEELE